MPSREEHHLNSEKLAEYPGGADMLRNMTDAADYAKQLRVPQVIRVSRSTVVTWFVVFLIPLPQLDLSTSRVTMTRCVP